MKKPSPFYIVVFMMLVAVVFGGAITGVNIALQTKLAKNEVLLEQKALVKAFSLGDPAKLSAEKIAELVTTRMSGLTEDTREIIIDPETNKSLDLLKAYETADKKKVTAIGFRFRGNAFWAPVEGFMSFTPDLEKTVGLVVVKQSETPGLGGRITEPVFTTQFAKGLKIAIPSENVKALEFVPPSDKDNTGTNKVQAISGATQTCNAVEIILNDHLLWFYRGMKSNTVSATKSASTCCGGKQI